MPAQTFLRGLALQGFRSFGRDMQRIYPFSGLNLFIGQNNCGKSNILSFIAYVVPKLSQGQPYELSGTDAPLRACDFRLGLPVSVDGPDFVRLASNTRHARLLERLVALPDLTHNTPYIWYDIDQRAKLPRGVNVQMLMKHIGVREDEWYSLWQAIRPGFSGGSIDTWVAELIAWITARRSELPETELISAFRRVGDPGSEPQDFSGIGIINRLAQLQNPGHANQQVRARFDTINRFVQDVLNNSSATIEIPYERDTINVHMDGKTLPLPSLGTGVHEVIILAAAASIIRNQIVCIEEPEIHLHPLLQRKLLRYLTEKTDNQYFITTHSAHLIDVPGASVFHAKLVDGNTVVAPAVSPDQKSDVCADLGYRASDLMQANFVIWVEGPSDRLYVNHWIHAIEPDLREGIHYSIMFYGGRLLNHLTANDAEVNEFISLRRLNRNLAIIMDSDKRSRAAKVNETKARVERELSEPGKGIAWITAGREIENYLDLDDLRAAVESVAPGLGVKVSPGLFRQALPLVGSAKSGRSIDKIKVAHAVTQHPAKLDQHDLRQRVEQLVQSIRAANDDRSAASSE